MHDSARILQCTQCTVHSDFCVSLPKCTVHTALCVVWVSNLSKVMNLMLDREAKRQHALAAAGRAAKAAKKARKAKPPRSPAGAEPKTV